MTGEPVRSLGPIQPADATTPQSAAAPAAPETTEFRRMLERLEQLGAKAGAATPPAADVESFAQALNQADLDFVAAMDLRRRLEEAFRKAQP